MKEKKVYISGKITGLDIEVAKQYFATTAQQIAELGFTPIDPMAIVPYHPDWTWEQYMLADIELIFGCQHIFMLDNWEDSRGARCERALAYELGMTIHHSFDSLITYVENVKA